MKFLISTIVLLGCIQTLRAASAIDKVAQDRRDIHGDIANARYDNSDPPPEYSGHQGVERTNVIPPSSAPGGSNVLYSHHVIQSHQPQTHPHMVPSPSARTTKQPKADKDIGWKEACLGGREYGCNGQDRARTCCVACTNVCLNSYCCGCIFGCCS